MNIYCASILFVKVKEGRVSYALMTNSVLAHSEADAKGKIVAMYIDQPDTKGYSVQEVACLKLSDEFLSKAGYEKE